MHPSTSLARAVVDGLILAGVRHVVLSPGSRSAPLAYELQDADRAGRLTLHVRVDERSAGFLALGLAKVSRVPAAVVTTSGTAVANLHPAVLEAHHGLVPLVVLSADRPAELRGIGANQTTTQPGIFGAVVRAEAELDPLVGDGRTWVEEVRTLVVRSRGGSSSTAAVLQPPGPVHVDLGFREPLVPDLREAAGRVFPDAEQVTPGGGAASHADETASAGGRTVSARGETARLDVRPLRFPDRTLVVLGDLPEPDQPRRVAAWAAEQGWPVVAEPFGEQPLGPTVIPHGPLLLGTGWSAAHSPEHVVVAGRVTLSRPVRATLTEDPGRVTYLSAGPRWLGPSFPVGRTVDLDAVLAAPSLTAGPRRRDWLRSWLRAAESVASNVADECRWGSGPGLARELAAALPDDSCLVVGSSNAVRDLEIAVDWGAGLRDRGPSAPSGPSAAAGRAPGRIRVVANRGLAGIDGVVSTAVGIGLASSRSTYALVGDLTFLHDVNALLVGPLEPRPDLTVVVANDDGGGIFATLEPGEPERADDFERVFGTPTGVRIEDLARAYSIPYAQVTSPSELADLVGRPAGGLRVLEVAVDRRGHRDLRAALRARAERATAAERTPEPRRSPGRPDRDYPERDMRV